MVFAQAPSITIQHSGLAPNDTLWVMPGDSIDFIYGGGGNHPMTSGQGVNASPVFFPTVTVNSSTPLSRVALSTVGTYIFHCGTNPGNTNNWGTIIVSEFPAGISENNLNKLNISIFPNPSQTELNVKAPNDLNGMYSILDLNGKVLIKGNLKGKIEKINISTLPTGSYFINFRSANSILTKSFIKN